MESPAPQLAHAWITTPDGTYAVATSHRSPVFELIERIYAAEAARPKSRARSILRCRIFIDREPTPSERETVKVAAKRIEFSAGPPPVSSLPLPELPPAEPFSFTWNDQPFAPGTAVREEEIRPLLEALRARPEEMRARWASDRPVSAILLDESRKLLSFAWNTHAAIRTRHAEWNLCENLFREGRKIPAGSRLYVSLKPCRMCAARIWELAEDPTRLSVHYLENDPGPFAQETLLDTASLTRRRYFGARHHHFELGVQSAL